MIEITEEGFLSGKRDRGVFMEIEKGGLIIFPSENSYGFAGNATSELVIENIHEIKQEPADKPIGMITDSAEKLEGLLEIDEKGKKLLEHRFSGPLTILFKATDELLCPCAHNGFAGVRIPLRKSLLKLCSLVDYPLTAPSANIHGEKAIFDGEEIHKVFGKKKVVLINAGKLEEELPSTYYNYETGEILRQGKVTLEEIKQHL